jgi:hypothetical protein
MKTGTIHDAPELQNLRNLGEGHRLRQNHEPLL